MTTLRLGTRGSPLALAQARIVGEHLQARDPDVHVGLEVIRTHGDEGMGGTGFTDLSGKALFTQRIEEALVTGRIDAAVHSLKDLPNESLPGIVVAAVPEREDPRDALVSPQHGRLESLPHGATVATSSLRRASQLLARRPDLQIVALRGNVETRIRKLHDQGWDAIVLAAAGLRRLGLDGHITHLLDPDLVLPAPGQGALAIQTRQDSPHFERVAELEDPLARAAVEAERSFAAELGADCNTPVAAWAHVRQKRLHIRGCIATPDGSQVVRADLAGDVKDPQSLGVRLAQGVLRRGARHILGEVQG